MNIDEKIKDEKRKKREQLRHDMQCALNGVGVTLFVAGFISAFFNIISLTAHILVFGTVFLCLGAHFTNKKTGSLPGSVCSSLGDL